MWIYRRLFKIPWTDHVSNADILQRIGQGSQLLNLIKKKLKTAYLGHIMHNQKYELLQLIIQGKIEGRRGIGRKQASWRRNIRHWTGMHNVGVLLNAARNREGFSNIINNII